MSEERKTLTAVMASLQKELASYNNIPHMEATVIDRKAKKAIVEQTILIKQAELDALILAEDAVLPPVNNAE